MSDRPQGFGPQAQHEQLLAKVGKWRVECTYFMSGAEPMRAIGSDHVEALGHYWTLGHFECDMAGTTIRGLATTGYDPSREVFVGTWQDTATPFFYRFEGDLYEDGTLVLEGMNFDPFGGHLVNYRSVETLGENDRKLELFLEPPDVDPIQILEYVYRRV